MKFTVLTVAAALAAPLIATAAPSGDKGPFDPDSVCHIQGFKVSPTPIKECCLSHTGGFQYKWIDNSYKPGQKIQVMRCRLPIGEEGPFRKCVKDLHYATAIDCYYYQADEPN
ncbi:hypothetical protein BGZ96_000492 [Linnemannia gamsii]|uniref:Uncharacterized protein n=1 Tax=Linnemannia gamsii TaxID=64522 RepID=A0ABQ7JPC0_9FUNG|nr:hypothetical protein BGZ96_000492 [Linnemannia gamsii]